MPVSLSKTNSLAASSALGHTVFLPSGIRVQVLAVTPLPSPTCSAHAPRVRLVGRTRHGGDVVATFPRATALRPAQDI
jgi:hypothetical protein